jgi:hypothetical protein
VSFDVSPYTGTPSNGHLALKGATDSYTGLSFNKDYSVDSASGWITILYTINASKAIKTAPWEDSRVPRGGIVFFPAGDSLTVGPLTDMAKSSSGIVWFDDAAKKATSAAGEKAVADGSEGWSAYALNGVLFLKKFTDVPASAQVTGEGEIAVYPGTGFLEVEVEGPYTQIAAKGTLPWTVQWRVVKIPESVTVKVDSATLVDFARQQVK